MSIFLVSPLASNADQIGMALKKVLPKEDIYEIQGRTGWFVNYEGTTVELSNLIGITSADREIKPTLGSGMVTSVGSYYGMGSTAMWEWLKSRIEGSL